MSRKAKVWLSCSVLFLGYLGLMRFVPAWINLSGRNGWILFGSLGVIGAIAFIFSAIFLGKRIPAPAPPKDPLSVELEATLTQAQRRLIDARVARGKVLQKLPAVLVLGPRQNHKTSAVIRSGINAETLAGDVLRGVQVVPTQTANIWYAGSALIVEVGTDVVQSPERWNRLLHRLQPARLSGALARGDQAPRAVLLCVSCENFLRPGARDATVAAARELRGVVSDVARAYGIRLPVYVLFTKADDIPGFKEYVRHFSAEEARDVLGATLLLAEDLRASDYADRATAVIRGEFRSLFECLASRRVDILAREDLAAMKPAAYQFPRELRKLEPLMVDFLVELGRPSDLQTSAFVRGFYFSGVREVVAADGGGPPLTQAPAAPLQGDAGATALLRPVARPDASAPQPAARGAVRREAQWVFLDRLLSLVVLNDSVALGMTRGGTRVSFFRRAAIATATAAAALFLIVVLSSFVGNRRLQSSTRRAIAATSALPATRAQRPSVDELRVLDSLGSVLDTLSDYEHGFGHVGLGWGLSQVEPLYGASRTAYFAHLGRLVMDSTRRTMAWRLATMADSPLSGEQFASAYARLKAYLIITNYPDSTTGDSLASVLVADWPDATRLDSTGQALALRHFRRFARELKWRNPYTYTADDAAVGRARTVLSQSGGDQQIYLAILATASRVNTPIRLAGQGQGTITVPFDIQPAYTRPGYNAVRMALDNDIDRYLQGEKWVLGASAVGPSQGERDRLRRVLRARYETEYVDYWRKLLKNVHVTPFANLNDAMTKLNLLASPNSPLLYVFGAANESLGFDSLGLGKSFGPLRQVGAPTLAASRVTEAMKPYQASLQSLAQKIQGVAGPTPAAASPTFGEAIDAVGAVKSAVNAVGLSPRDQVEVLGIERLLREPADYADRVLRGAQRTVAEAPAGGGGPPPIAIAKPLNDTGLLFCSDFKELAKKRPFAADGPDATVAEMGQILTPGSGRLWAFGGELGAVVRRSGIGFAEKPNAPMTLNPEALRFLNTLAMIVDGLYPNTAPEPQLVFDIAPNLTGRQKVTIKFGSPQVVIYEVKSMSLKHTVQWKPSQDVTISISDANGFKDVRNTGIAKQWTGAWAPLQFFAGAANWAPAADDPKTYRFTIELRPGAPLPFQATMDDAVRNVVRGGIFRDIPACPEWWVREKR